MTDYKLLRNQRQSTNQSKTNWTRRAIETVVLKDTAVRWSKQRQLSRYKIRYE